MAGAGVISTVGAPPTRLPVIAIALISSVSASIPKVHLAPLPRLRWPVFLGEPLAFTLGLDPGAIDQKVQGGRAGATGDGNIQTARTGLQGAEIRHRPRQTGKL